VMWMSLPCVVTDEIEFYDKVTCRRIWTALILLMISSILSPYTSETFQSRCGIRMTKTLALIGPESESSNSRIPAELRRRGKTVMTDPLESIPDPKMYDGGVMVTLKCKILYQLENAPEETTVVVQMIVDDREFEVSSEDEARELQVNWTRQVYPQNTN